MNELREIVATLLAPGKGILAADESTGTITRRFTAEGIESDEESRRAYRELLFTTPEIDRYLGGVILYDETIRQAASDGTPLPHLLAERGILAGIKVDEGAKPLAFAPQETVTEGLDGLRERFAEYSQLGARFAKWRATYTIAEDRPSPLALSVNAHALARYAALAQEGGLVPIVEPEVLMDGHHSLAQSAAATAAALDALFAELEVQRVDLEGIVLKPNMVLAGYAGQAATSDEVADATLAIIEKHVPSAVSGVAFLSGGQPDESAIANLAAINRRSPGRRLTFSYARALQSAAMHTWAGRPDRVGPAQQVFLERLRLASAASEGRDESAGVG